MDLGIPLADMAAEATFIVYCMNVKTPSYMNKREGTKNENLRNENFSPVINSFKSDTFYQFGFLLVSDNCF